MHPNDLSSDRAGVFSGGDPFELARSWLADAQAAEMNDANAMALASVDGGGMPNVRMVLLKEIRDDAFVFFTNYTSQKAAELDTSTKAAAVLHWKSLRRQLRFRGQVERADDAASDAYFATRSVFSRVGAWASDQSSPITDRTVLETRAQEMTDELGENPKRPPFWGGYVIVPQEIEFWCDGSARLHDRFRWTRTNPDGRWDIVRLNP
ncbi:MAG: pyridoxamine 5'-phosphate oxidase [Pseudomonadota bacterium]